MPTETTNIAGSASASDEDGHWVTIDGTHIFIRNGVVEKGPANLVGKSGEVKLSRQLDFFGNEVGNLTGSQRDLFAPKHEPVKVEAPQAERIGSKNAADPKHTGEMFKVSHEEPGAMKFDDYMKSKATEIKQKMDALAESHKSKTWASKEISDKVWRRDVEKLKQEYYDKYAASKTKLERKERDSKKLALASDEPGHWITLDGNHIFIGGSAGAVPSRLKAGDGEKTRFSKAELQRHILAHHESVGGKGTYTAAGESALNEAAGAGDPFTFHRKLPTEVKEFMAGRPELRSMFKVSGDSAHAGGADAFGALGDRYLDIAEAKAGSPLRAAKATAHASNDPEVKLLAAIHDNLPEGRFSGETIKAQGLRVGDQFTIGGSKFRVAEDSEGFRVLEGGKDYPDTPVDALRQLPIDKGSFRHGKKPKFEPAPFSADGAIFALSSDAATTALMMGWPNEIDGQKVHYRRKEIAQAKHYVNRGKRKEDGTFDEFTIARDRMDGWVDSFKRRAANGIKPFVPEKHVRAANDARANFGYLVDMNREDDSLYGTFQLIGDEALAASTRNDVSIYVVADATDAEGNHYEEAIEHVCLTPNPVIPNLKPFERIAASADRPAIDAPVFVLAVTTETAPSREGKEMNKELAAKVRAKLGIGADVPDDQLSDKVAEKVLALSADIVTLTTERDTLKAERDGKAAEVLALSADPKFDPLSLAMYSRACKTDRESVIAAGVVSEAGMKEIDSLMFSEGKPTRAALALSAGSTEPFYSRLCDILRRFPGIKTQNVATRAVGIAEPQKQPELALSADQAKDKDLKTAGDQTVDSVYAKYRDRQTAVVAK